MLRSVSFRVNLLTLSLRILYYEYKKMPYCISISLYILFNKTRIRLVHLYVKKDSAFQAKNGLQNPPDNT